MTNLWDCIHSQCVVGDNCAPPCVVGDNCAPLCVVHRQAKGEREREGGREGGVHRHKINVGRPVSLGIYARLPTGYGYASWAARSNS